MGQYDGYEIACTVSCEILEFCKWVSMKGHFEGRGIAASAETEIADESEPESAEGPIVTLL